MLMPLCCAHCTSGCCSQRYSQCANSRHQAPFVAPEPASWHSWDSLLLEVLLLLVHLCLKLITGPGMRLHGSTRYGAEQRLLLLLLQYVQRNTITPPAERVGRYKAYTTFLSNPAAGKLSLCSECRATTSLNGSRPGGVYARKRESALRKTCDITSKWYPPRVYELVVAPINRSHSKLSLELHRLRL